MHRRHFWPTAPRLALLLVLTMALGACTAKIVHPPLGVTFLPRPGEFVSGAGERLSFGEVLKLAEGKDYILVGEDHRNGCDHTVQQRLLAGLAESDTPPVVGLEMVAVDMQPVLDRFAAGQIDVDGLEAELEWSERWGYPYALFRGHFETIRRHSLPVAGLNAPSAVTRKIARQGLEALTPDERAWLPAEIVPVSNAQAPYLDMILEQHLVRDARELPLDEAVRRERFFLVQAIWDSKMAEVAVAMHRQYDWPVLVVAGGGHVENGWGIARRIRQFDPAAKILLVMPWRGDEFDSESGDVFFFCPETYESKMGATLTATGRGGLLVESVTRGSRADLAGLRPGDTLLQASGVPLDRLMDLHMAGFKVHEADAPLVFTVWRGGLMFKADMGKLGVKAAKSMPKDAPADETPMPKSSDTPGPQPETGRGR